MNIAMNCEPIQELLKLTKSDISVIAKDKIYLIAETEPKELIGNRVMITVDGEITTKGQTIISRTVLSNISKNGQLIIDKNTIKCGTRSIKFKDNFETLVPMEIGERFLTIPKAEFDKGIDVDYAIATDDTRPVLKGIFLDNYNFVALDGYRLAIREHNISANEDGFGPNSFEVLIPGELIKLYKKLKSNSDINIYVEDNFITLEIGDIQISVRKIEGVYIKYKSLLPQDHKLEVKVESQELLKLLQSYKDIKLVKFKLESNEITISAINEVMTIKDTLNCKMKGEPIEIAFNPKYLIDTLKHYKDSVIFELKNSTSPLVIKDFEKYDLILPVRVKSN